jgi:hypothetical protein
MIAGGYSNSSVKSLRIMVNLPSMVERWYTLNAKYNIRSTTLPAGSLIYQIIQSNKRYSKLKLIEKKNHIYQKFIKNHTQNISAKTTLTKTISSYRSKAIINSSEKMIQACRSTLILDSILTLPMTRKERRRLLRWRMNWFPGTKSQCYCGGLMSRNHLFECPAIPEPYWEHIQRGSPSNINPVDLVIKRLPTKKPKSAGEKQQMLQQWQPLFTDLLNILFLVDQICHSTQESFADEPDSGDLFYKWIVE